MEISYDIDADYLTATEINYELLIRGFLATTDDVKRRRCLRRLMEMDLKRPGVSYSCNTFVRDTDGAEIDRSITSLSSLIESYTGALDSTFVEIRSRMNHLKGRLLRIHSPDELCLSFKNDRLISTIALEDEFLTLVANVSQAEGGPSAVERPGSGVVLQGGNSPGVALVADMTEVLEDTPNTHRTIPLSRSDIVPVYKWGIKFSGEPSSDSVADVLQRIEELSESRGITKDKLFRSVYDLLEGPALVWYRSVHRSITSWDEFVRQLKLEFQPLDYVNELWNEIFHRMQGPDEKVGTYFACMINLFSRLPTPTTEAQRLNVIRRNLTPYFLNHLGTSVTVTVEELKAACKQLEENRHLADRNGGRPSASCIVEPAYAYQKPKPLGVGSVRNVSALNNLTCWNCREVGHLSASCDKPRLVKHCYGCGQAGVIRSKCPKCSGNERPKDL